MISNKFRMVCKVDGNLQLNQLKHLGFSNTRIILKLILGLYFQSFSSITLNIITLPTLGKSVVVKNIPRNIFYFSAFCGS